MISDNRIPARRHAEFVTQTIKKALCDFAVSRPGLMPREEEDRRRHRTPASSYEDSAQLLTTLTMATIRQLPLRRAPAKQGTPASPHVQAEMEVNAPRQAQSSRSSEVLPSRGHRRPLHPLTATWSQTPITNERMVREQPRRDSG